jgi:hypothetical protein
MFGEMVFIKMIVPFVKPLFIQEPSKINLEESLMLLLIKELVDIPGQLKMALKLNFMEKNGIDLLKLWHIMSLVLSLNSTEESFKMELSFNKILKTI